MEKKTRYNSYVIVGKSGEKPIIIDWTKIKRFAKLKSKRYRLDKIDFFTTHYTSRESLIAELINSEVLTPSEARGIKLQLCQVRQDKKALDGIDFKPNGNLRFGLAYKAYLPLFKYDKVVIRTLQDHLDDYDFIESLCSKYRSEGPYNDFAFDALENKIHKIENAEHYNYSEYQKQKKALQSYRYRYQQMAVVRGLLDSMLAYASHKTHTPGETRSAYNNAKEFFLRIKYQVVSSYDRVDDATELTFKENKDGTIAVKYLEFHNFIMWLGSKLDLELGEFAQNKEEIVYPLAKKKKTIKKRTKKDQVEGQTSLFDDVLSDEQLMLDDDEENVQTSLFGNYHESLSDSLIPDYDDEPEWGHQKTKK